MPRYKPCSRPGCPELTTSGRCDSCRRDADAQRRARPDQQAYNSPQWRRRRAAYLAVNLFCALCRAPSTVADHYPISRRDLVDMGVPGPDAPERLRPLCKPCHSRETARHQPGGWADRPPA